MCGLHRMTVKKYLTKGVLPVYKKAMRKSILEPYRGLIESWLAQQDYQATRIHELLVAQGFIGSYDTVKRYVAGIKEQRDRKAYIRFETLPGQQAQVDWASFGLLVVDGVRKALSCFSMILGFSRHQYIEFTLSRNLATFLSCHVRAFEYFGGLPAEVLYDNLKTAVLSHIDGTVEWQSTFTDFAAYYGFTPRACRPYRAQTKGKVERPFPYIRSNFFQGHTFAGLDEIKTRSRRWLDQTANCRIHGTTRERPVDRFQKKRGHLRPLPAQAYRTVETIFRSSTRDCVISYSVPARYAAHRHLRVEVAPDQLTVYHNQERIAVHRLCHGKHHRFIDPKHLEGLVPDATVTPLQLKLRELRALGPVALSFADGLVKTQTRFLPWTWPGCATRCSRSGPTCS